MSKYCNSLRIVAYTGTPLNDRLTGDSHSFSFLISVFREGTKNYSRSMIVLFLLPSYLFMIEYLKEWNKKHAFIFNASGFCAHSLKALLYHTMCSTEVIFRTISNPFFSAKVTDYSKLFHFTNASWRHYAGGKSYLYTRPKILH